MAYYYNADDDVPTQTLVPRDVLAVVSRESFLDRCERDCGVMVAAQAQAILSRRPCEEQNPNALEYIRCLARDLGEARLARALGDYMEGLQY